MLLASVLLSAVVNTRASRTFVRCEVTSAATPAPSDSILAAHLISDALVIVGARALATDAAASPGTTAASVGVRFERLETVKGTDTIPRFFNVAPAALTDDHDFNGHAVPYIMVRPSGCRGSCYATTYHQGSEYLFFMNRGPDGVLTPDWAPLMPTNEELQGPTDLWLQWVRAHRR